MLAPVAPVIRYTGEHHIGPVLIWELVLYHADWPDSRLLGRGRRLLPSRRGRQEAIFFGDPGEPVALPGGVIRWLRATMELARTMQSLLV